MGMLGEEGMGINTICPGGKPGNASDLMGT